MRSFILVAMILVLMPACRSVERTHGFQDEHAYLHAVQDYGDALLEHGLDRYGDWHSPLIASALDQNRHTLFESAALEALHNIPRGR